jgi:hypothetical protein
MRIMLLASLAFCVALVSGCGTSDYNRITDKIAAYESQAATTRAHMQSSTERAQKIRGYNSLISLTRKEIELARRINPETNPAYKSGTMTLEQARQEKAARVAKLDQQLTELTKARDAEIMAQTPTP